jgi:peptidoglycan/LPS O-acetylase OafA/YrhL
MLDSLRQERSNLLDAVRGVAILMVVLFHYFPTPLTNFGWTGVNLFFILSGFLIGGILIDYQASSKYYSTFYARRAFRIVPLYALDVALFAILVGLDQPLWHYATFIQNFTWSAHGDVGPGWMAPTWSLAIEEQFYLLLPLIVRVTGFRRLPYVAGGAILLAPAYRLFMTQWLGANWPAADHTLLGALDSLFLGVLIAWAIRTPAVLGQLQRHRCGLWAASGIGLAGVIALFADPPAAASWAGTLSISWIAFTYGLLFVGLVTRSGRAGGSYQRGPLCWLGIGAYSVYLFHVPVAFAMETLFSAPMLAHLVAAPILIAVAVACWYGIERPLISAARRRWRYGLVGMRGDASRATTALNTA